MQKYKLLVEIKKWEKLFSDNSDLIFQGKDYNDIEKGNLEKKTAIFFGSGHSFHDHTIVCRRWQSS